MWYAVEVEGEVKSLHMNFEDAEVIHELLCIDHGDEKVIVVSCLSFDYSEGFLRLRKRKEIVPNGT